MIYRPLAVPVVDDLPLRTHLTQTQEQLARLGLPSFSITSAAANDTLRFDGTNWVNSEVITELSLIGYDYVMSYEHEDVTMSRQDGITKTIAYLKPLLIEKPYEGRNDILFQ